MKKRIIAAVTMLTLFTGTAAAVSSYTKTIDVEYGISLSINGRTPTLTDVNGKTVQPFVYDGTTYVPIRAAAQRLGGVVGFDSASNAATIDTFSALYLDVAKSTGMFCDLIDCANYANLQSIYLTNLVSTSSAGRVSTDQILADYDRKFTESLPMLEKRISTLKVDIGVLGLASQTDYMDDATANASWVNKNLSDVYTLLVAAYESGKAYASNRTDENFNAWLNNQTKVDNLLDTVRTDANKYYNDSYESLIEILEELDVNSRK